MMDFLKTVLYWVVFSSINASIAALIIIALRAVLKNRITPRVLCLLWFLVIMKLFTAPITAKYQINAVRLFNYQQFSGNVPDKALDTVQKKKTVMPDKPVKDSRDIINDAYPQITQDPPRYQKSIDIESCLALVWAAGTVVLSSVFMCSGIKFSKRLRTAEKLPDALLPDAIRTYNQNQAHPISFYISSGILIPCMAGIIKPKVYIPEHIFAQADEQQLTHMLMHEIAHVKRKDNLLNVLAAAVNAVHWFNPVLWYSIKLFNLDREISCDAYALEALGQKEAVPYGLTLLYHSNKISKIHFQLNASSYFKSQKQIRRRILMIKNYKKGSYRITAAALILCVIFGLSTLVNAAGIDYKAESPAGKVQTENSNDPIREALSNKSYMHFSSLRSVQNFSDLAFKVPDYLPEGFKLYSFFLYPEKINKQDLLVVSFWSAPDGGKMISGNEEHFFGLSVSKDNLLSYVKSNKNAAFKEEQTVISGLDATFMTVQTKQKAGNHHIAVYTTKHLIWQDQNIWYDLEYYSASSAENSSQINVHDNMSLDDLKKITASMNISQNIKTVDYTSDFFAGSFAIYDGAGLADAKTLLGFTPRFPLCINDQFSIFSAGVNSGKYLKDDKDTPILTTKYRSKDNTLIEVEQSRLSSLYDSISESGSITVVNPDTQLKETLQCKNISIGGTKVFVFKSADNNTYVWQQDGVYFTASVSACFADHNTIMTAFITQHA